MSQKLQPVPRRHHKKSFTGCQRCKDRKIKCDEARPLCKNCAKHYSNIEQCFFSPVGEFEGSIKEARNMSAETAFYQVNPAHVINLKRDVKPKTTRIPPLYQEMTTSAVVISNLDNSHRLRSQSSESKIPMTVGAVQIDPFNTLPATKAPDADMLLNHYLSTFVLRNFLYFTTCPMVKLWWPLIQSDSLLFQVALLISSLGLEEGNGPKEANHSMHLIGGRRSRQLQAECIRQLTERVQDTALGISDHTIVAVANLAAIEHERGNIRMVQMHMDGLKRMVSMRGGLNAIRAASPLAANIAFWMSAVAMSEPQHLPAEFVGYEEPILNDLAEPQLVDFGILASEGTPNEFSNITLPHFNIDEPHQPAQNIEPHETYLSYHEPSNISDQSQLSLAFRPNTEHSNTHLISRINPSSVTQILLDFSTLGLPPSHAHLLQSIQHLSSRFATILDYSPTSSTSSETVFSELCYILQCLLRLPVADLVTESCRYAAAVQLVSPLWGYFPDCTLLVSELVHNLSASLRGLVGFRSPVAGSLFLSNEHAIRIEFNYLFLWLFSVGAAEGHGHMPERDWFINHLVVVASEAGIENWEMMKSVLVRFIWHDIFCEGPFGEVWLEMEERRKVVKGLEMGVR